jgi:microsomal epoxide hydrolase
MPEQSPVPVGVAVFAHDYVRPVRSLAERTDKVVHWTEFADGGHFPAMEQPEALVADIRAFFGGLD